MQNIWNHTRAEKYTHILKFTEKLYTIISLFGEESFIIL